MSKRLVASIGYSLLAIRAVMFCFSGAFTEALADGGTIDWWGFFLPLIPALIVGGMVGIGVYKE